MVSKQRGRPVRKDIDYRRETKLVRLSPSSCSILRRFRLQSMDHAVKHLWKLLAQKGKLIKEQKDENDLLRQELTLLHEQLDAYKRSRR